MAPGHRASPILIMGDTVMSSRFSRTFAIAYPPVLTFIVVLVLWQGITTGFHVPVYIFPSPAAVWQQATLHRQALLGATAATVEESVLGLLLGALVGFLGGTLFTYSGFARRSLYPYAIALQTTPILAIAPLIIMWVGSGVPARVIIAAIIGMFPVLVNTALGMMSVTPAARDLMHIYQVSRLKEFLYLRVPTTLPYTLSALKVSATLSIIGALVAEFVTGNAGLGFIIIESSYQMETAYLFSAIIAAALTGLVFFLAVEILSYLLLHRWHDSHRNASRPV